MHKKELLLIKVSALVSLIGLLVLSLFYSPQPMLDNEINISDIYLNKTVNLSGTVENLRETPTNLIISLKEHPEGIIIASRNKDYKIKPADYIKVTGKLEKFSNIFHIESETIQVY